MPLVLVATFILVSQTLHRPEPAGWIDALSVTLCVSGLTMLGLATGRALAMGLAALVNVLAVSWSLASLAYAEVFQSFMPSSALLLATSVLEVAAQQYALELFLASVAAVGTLAGLFWIFWRQTNLLTSKKLLVYGLVLSVTGVCLQLIYENTATRYGRTIEAAPLGFALRSAGLIPLVEGDYFAHLESRGKVVEAYLEASIQEGGGVPQAIREVLADYYSVNPGPYPLYQGDVQRTSAVSRYENVIVLVLESVRAQEVQGSAIDQPAAPFLQSLQDQSVYFPNAFATAPLTIKSEVAINCGVLDFFGVLTMSKEARPRQLRCLPEIFGDVGMDSIWIHGYTSNFYNRETFHRDVLGFRQLWDINHFYGEEFDAQAAKTGKPQSASLDQARPILGWGIPDPVLFDYALKGLSELDTPFYAQILTLSNHLPFDFEWDIEFPEYLQNDDSYLARYRRGIYYTDRALAHFFERFLASPLSDNTLLVVTGDHGIWTFPDKRPAPLLDYEQFFRTPLLFWGRDLEPLVKIDLASHLDVSKTILGLLGLRGGTAGLGVNLLADNEAKFRPPVPAMMDAKFGFFTEESACVPVSLCFRNSLECIDPGISLRKGAELVCYQPDWSKAGSHLPSPYRPKILGSAAIRDEQRWTLLIDYIYAAQRFGFSPD